MSKHNLTYRGHTITRDDNRRCWDVFEQEGEHADLEALWSGRTIEDCMVVIDEVLDEMEGYDFVNEPGRAAPECDHKWSSSLVLEPMLGPAKAFCEKCGATTGIAP